MFEIQKEIKERVVDNNEFLDDVVLDLQIRVNGRNYDLVYVALPFSNADGFIISKDNFEMFFAMFLKDDNQSLLNLLVDIRDRHDFFYVNGEKIGRLDESINLLDSNGNGIVDSQE